MAPVYQEGLTDRRRRRHERQLIAAFGAALLSAQQLDPQIRLELSGG
jgi:hypothetical protein